MEHSHNSPCLICHTVGDSCVVASRQKLGLKTSLRVLKSHTTQHVMLLNLSTLQMDGPPSLSARCNIKTQITQGRLPHSGDDFDC